MQLDLLVFSQIFEKLKAPRVAHIRGGGGWWFTVAGLGSRLIVMIKQADEILAILKLLLNFDSFSSGACLGCLNRFVVLITYCTNRLLASLE